MTPNERAIDIAKKIGKLISEEGGTSSHIAAATVELPASVFDALEVEQGFRPRGEKGFRLYGVRFSRGLTDEQIRGQAKAAFQEGKS